MACYYLNQQSDRAALIHFQDFTVLGPDQDVAVAERYGAYGGVVLQKQPCGVASSQRELLFQLNKAADSSSETWLPLEPGANTDLLMA